MSDIAQLENGVAAVQYGTPEGQWDSKALIRVAAFITGVDLDKGSITEDQILDVVRPVGDFWDPQRDIADIEVITGKRILGMTLGQWLVKYPTGFYRVLSTNDYLSQVGPPRKAPSFRQELTHLLNKHSKDAQVEVPDFILARHIDNDLNNMVLLKDSISRYERGE